MQGDLIQKSINGVGWNFLENIANYLIKFIIGIILARLLSPSDYGLIGMTVVFFTIAEVFINSGFSQAFIQKKDASEMDASTIFIINFVVSLLFYVVFWFCAPSIANFFNQPILIKLIRIMSVIVIINSLNIIQLAIIRKNLEFKKKTYLTLISSLVSGIIGIISAIYGLNVWSLVIQQITNRIIICVGLYFTSKWRLKFQFSYFSFKQLFSYGSWLLLSNIIIKIFNNFYRIVIGKFFPASELGLFDRGNQFPGMIYQQISWSVGAVAFPVYSKLLDNKMELQRSLLRFVKYSTFITLPLLSILFIVAEPFVLLLLTKKWEGAIIFIKLFCLVGAIFPLYGYLTQYIEAIGFTKHNFLYTIFINLLRITNVVINLKNGISAIIIGEAVVLLISLLGTSFLSRKLMGFNYLTIVFKLKWIYLSIILSTFLGRVIYLISPDILIAKLIIPGFTVIITYFSCIYLLDKKLIQNILSIIKNRRL